MTETNAEPQTPKEEADRLLRAFNRRLTDVLISVHDDRWGDAITGAQSLGSDAYRNFNEIVQRLRECAQPQLDLEAYVLERVRADTFSNGVFPNSLTLLSRDGRITREALAPVVDRLLAEGRLVYRKRSLWLPEKWEAKSRAARARSHAKPAAKAPVVQWW